MSDSSTQVEAAAAAIERELEHADEGVMLVINVSRQPQQAQDEEDAGQAEQEPMLQEECVSVTFVIDNFAAVMQQV
jgi:hypothetical protein